MKAISAVNAKAIFRNANNVAAIAASMTTADPPERIVALHPFHRRRHRHRLRPELIDVVDVLLSRISV